VKLNLKRSVQENKEVSRKKEEKEEGRGGGGGARGRLREKNSRGRVRRATYLHL
jgi:hypothetical protein